MSIEAIKNVVMCHELLRSVAYFFVLYVLAMLQHSAIVTYGVERNM